MHVCYSSPVRGTESATPDAKVISSPTSKKGLGDGSKAAQLKTQPADLSTATFQSQTDGSVFYKISEGRGDMPSFKKKLPDAEDIWNLVIFFRTLKK